MRAEYMRTAARSHRRCNFVCLSKFTSNFWGSLQNMTKPLCRTSENIVSMCIPLPQRWPGLPSFQRPPCHWLPAALLLPCCSIPAWPASPPHAVGSVTPCCSGAWLACGCPPHTGRPPAVLHASVTACSPAHGLTYSHTLFDADSPLGEEDCWPP